jgi:hypothetical protein
MLIMAACVILIATVGIMKGSQDSGEMDAI